MLVTSWAHFIINFLYQKNSPRKTNENITPKTNTEKITGTVCTSGNTYENCIVHFVFILKRKANSKESMQ